GILVLLPSLGVRWLGRLVFKQRFTSARYLATLLSWLHPADGWGKQPKILYALELGQQGNFTAAEQLLHQYEARNDALGRFATIQLHRMSNQWEALRDWFEKDLNRFVSQYDGANLTLYLRALGETGNPNKLIQAYDQFQPAIRANPSAAALSRLFVLAFSGQVDDVHKLMQGPLANLAEATQQLWVGTAHLTAGQQDEGQQQLDEITNHPDRLVQVAIERRQHYQLPVADTILTTDSHQRLNQLRVELEQEAKFGAPSRAKRRSAYATYSLIGLNLFAFGSAITMGGSEDPYTLYLLGALFPSLSLADSWWRLITYMFLHFGWLHLVLNMLALYILGPFVELSLAIRKYFLIYFSCGVGAGLTVIMINWLQPEPQFLVGASGSIMGLIGATGAILWRGWWQEKSAVASRRLIFIVLIIILQVITDLLIPQISMTAHLSGLIIGFGLALLLYQPNHKAA
ncbi:MAG: rhomboid family intramembrane serine protease, partial [Chloroflexota bacterium]